MPSSEHAVLAERTPELTVLGALAHRERLDEASLRAAGRATIELGDSDRGALYFDLFLATFGAALSNATEDLMEYVAPMSEWGKKHFREGKAEGRAEGEAEALLRVLAVRGLVVSMDQRHTILSCTDPERLGRWIDHALAVESVARLLEIS